MHGLDVGIILFNEHNSDTKKSGIRVRYKMRLQKQWLVNRTEFSARKIKGQNDYLPGRTEILVLGH